MSKRTTNKKYPKWFYAIPILLPVVFLVLLELGLRIFNYRINLDQWIDATPTHYMLNDQVARRYFYSTKNVPYSSGHIFEKEKSDNTFRVFVLGGSSAAGYPYTPANSFAKYVRKRLQLLYPSKNIEVVNLAFSAINTYTIRDLTPGVLEQKPDLILIYAGHNEYYGALGAGSTESLGSNTALVNLALYLNKYKTTQLLRDIIKWFMSLFSSDEKSSGTLMSRMAKEQTIELNSDVYLNGLTQFKENMTDIISWITEAGVPIIVGNLTSNLKDQKPFINIKNGKYPEASSVYNEAMSLYKNKNYDSAKEKFIYAKDLDGLRFRAPSDMNKILVELADQFNIPLVAIDSLFNSASKNGIVGDNLMTDHLHPTIEGYQLIGKLFFEEMFNRNYLPDSPKSNITLSKQDSIVVANFDFTDLDSTIAHYRIIILKNDWPYKSKTAPLQQVLMQMNVNTYADSLALEVIDDKISWEKAHRNLALHHLHHGNIRKFKEELSVVIDQYPLIDEYYKIASRELLKIKEYEEAYPYLQEYYKRAPDEFSSKWLGIIDLSENRINSAIKYLEESKKFNYRDAQTLYNLAGAYSLNRDYKRALETINTCLRINPNFPGAENLRIQLMRAANSRN